MVNFLNLNEFYVVILTVILISVSSGDSKRQKRSYVEYREQEKSEYHEDQDQYTILGALRHSRSIRAAEENACISDNCKNEILKIPKGYNFFEIPFQPKIGNYTPPINVTMKTRVETIRDIDEVKEEITLDMEITLGWMDWKILAHRRNMSLEDVEEFIRTGQHLIPPKKIVTINNPQYLKTIWKPNLYIYDLIEKTQPKLMSDLITLKYDPDGGFIYYLTRVILKLSCPMEFKYYPTDTQRCRFLIRGFSYNEHLLNLQWYKAPFLADRQQSNFDVQLDNFESEKLQLREERFNGLSFTLLLRRKLSYHVVQTYIPSSFFIIITWLCFLIPSTMVEARIGISMTTLLTLTAMFASVRETSPMSAYVKALDIWMVSCIFSVFLTLFEFTLLTWLRHLKHEGQEKRVKKRREVLKISKESLEMNNMQKSSNIDLVQKSPSEEDDEENDKFEVYMRLIEKFAFAVFFIIFVVYNAIYWSWLFSSSGFLDWPTINQTLNIADEENNDVL